MSGAGLDWFSLKFPRDVEADAALAALSTFTGIPYGAKIVLDLAATNAGITHHLAVTPAHTESIAANLRAAIPSLRVTSTEPIPQDRQRVMVQLAPFVATIRSNDPGATAAALLASLFPLRKGELIRLRWTLRSGTRPAPSISGDSDLRGGRLKALRTKLAEPGLNVYGELSVRASDRGRRVQLLQRVASVLRSLSTPYGRMVLDPVWLGQLAKLFYLRGRYVSASELAAFIGWPIGKKLDLPGLELGAAKRLVPGVKLPRFGRVLGTSDFGGMDRSVALSPKASTKGSWILGPTGTGKTSLLKNLVADDLNQGRGVLVIETNGDLVKELADSIPTSRQKDTILLDPLDPDYAVGFNPFYSAADPSLIADQLGELFQRLWAAFWGPRTGQLSHMANLTLARRPGSTLLDVPRLFQDASFRARVLADLDDPLGLAPDWQWFESLSATEAAAIVAPLMNKARSWVARPAIRAVVGQARPKLTMRRVLEEKRVLLVHLPKGLLGTETAQLLGCLVLTSAWQAFAERAALSPDRRHPFAVYVDEWQDFASAPIPWEEMFAQGRKYGVSLTVAHQNITQLPRDLREIVLANARTKLAFALSSSDAKVLERVFAPSLTAEDLQALDPYSVAALVALDDGGVSRPVTLMTLPPLEALGSYAAVQENSRRHYGRRRDELEVELRQRVEGRKRSAPVGRKRRPS
jgi:hypothetical protein